MAGHEWGCSCVWCAEMREERRAMAVLAALVLAGWAGLALAAGRGLGWWR